MTLRTSLALLFAMVSVVQAQTNVRISDVGPGAAGRLLREALNRPHRLVEPDEESFTLRRGESQPMTLIVIGRTTYIGGKVEGDVIVVNADLFVRPGAEIAGRAIAIGGGSYPSTLAFVGGGAQSFYDDGFVVERTTEGYELAYRALREGSSPPLLFPGVYGLRIPTYDRVNGLSLPFGPALSFLDGRGEVNLLGTYRSDLGEVDPSLEAQLQFTRRTRASLTVERMSRTNDEWIWSNFVNSLAGLGLGTDTRNWYRADHGELLMHRMWEMRRSVLEPFVGAAFERSWPIGPMVGDSTGPWSLFGRRDSLGMLRPNPQVGKAEILSAIGGTEFRWEAEDGLQLRTRASVEKSIGGFDVGPTTGDFTQVTTDLDVRFPTFGEQQYRVEVHWVTSSGELPLQRFHYLGGPGTMPFLDLLEEGGGELLLVDQRYSIPLPRITVGFMGSPTLQLRHRLGAAGLGALPPLEQMVGVGVSLTVIRGELRLDPASGNVQLAAGFTFAR